MREFNDWHDYSVDPVALIGLTATITVVKRNGNVLKQVLYHGTIVGITEDRGKAEVDKTELDRLEDARSATFDQEWPAVTIDMIGNSITFNPETDFVNIFSPGLAATEEVAP